MADNVAVTAGSGTTIAADELTDGTLGTVKVQYVKLMSGTLDNTTKVAASSNGLNVDTGAITTVGAGTAPTNALVAGQIYNSAAPTPTNGQTLALQGDASGNLKVNLATALIAGTAIVGKVTTDQTTHGTSDLVAADITKVNGSAISLGHGTAATAVRVELPSDGTGVVGLIAGTAIVGKVTTDQTTHGTSDLVAADITKVAGATIAQGHGTAAAAIRVELPTDGTGVVKLAAGANLVGSASIDQTTPGTTNLVATNADAAIAAGTAPAKAFVTAAVFNTSAPSPSNGQTVALQVDSAGNLLSIESATASTLRTATPARIAAAASTNATSVKGSAGNVYSLNLINSTASALYFKLYNKASAPTVGTDTPLFTFQVPPNTSTGLLSVDWGYGIGFSTGIAYATTTGIADTDTAAVTLNAIHGVLGYK